MARRSNNSSSRAGGKPKKIKDWSKFLDDTATRQRHAIAEGLVRPAPSGKPPLNFEQHFALQVERIKAREEAAQNQQNEDPESE